MILITNKNSNILQDIDTLHLFARVTSDICRSLDESSVLRYSFELLGAFDEIVSLGYRENVNLTQVRSILEMESHEEKIQEIIERNKEMEAKEELKRRAKQLEMQRRDAARRGQMGGNSGGFGSSGGYSAVQQRFEPPPTQAPVQTGFGSSSTPAAKTIQGQGYAAWQEVQGPTFLVLWVGTLLLLLPLRTKSSPPLPTPPPPPSPPRPPLLAALHQQQHQPPSTLLICWIQYTKKPSMSLSKNAFSISGNRDGGLESLEIKGDLLLKITDPVLPKFAFSSHRQRSATSSSLPATCSSRPTHRSTRLRGRRIVSLRRVTPESPSPSTIPRCSSLAYGHQRRDSASIVHQLLALT